MLLHPFSIKKKRKEKLVRLSAGPCYENTHHNNIIAIVIYQSGYWNSVCWLENRIRITKEKRHHHLLLFTFHSSHPHLLTLTMRPSTFLVSSLAIFGAHAAPAIPKIDLKNVANPAAALDAISNYFNLIASKVQTSKVQPVAPICDMSKAQMPPSKYSFGIRYRQTWIWTNQWHHSSHWTAASICRLDAASRCRRPRHPELHVRYEQPQLSSRSCWSTGHSLQRQLRRGHQRRSAGKDPCHGRQLQLRCRHLHRITRPHAASSHLGPPLLRRQHNAILQPGHAHSEYRHSAHFQEQHRRRTSHGRKGTIRLQRRSVVEASCQGWCHWRHQGGVQNRHRWRQRASYMSGPACQH